MEKIVVLGTGGTIASDGLDVAVARRGAAELLRGVSTGYELDSRDIMMIGSYSLDFAGLRRIAEAACSAASEPGVTGVVVTHGTDTVEETAYLTSLIYEATRGSAPIVFTGAQFAPDTIAPDGARNLRDAIDFAAHPALQGSGTSIAFGGVLRTARGTSKAETLAPDPFRGGTVLARRAGTRITLDARPRFEVQALTIDPRFDELVVDAVLCAPGIDPALFQTAATRADAVVLVGTGLGNAGPGFVDAVARAVASGVPVVLTSRVPFGPVVPVYGQGGGVDLVRAGAIPSVTLSPAQARILTAALLAEDGASGQATDLELFSTRFAPHAE